MPTPQVKKLLSSESGIAPALALDDLPLGMLLAAGASEAIDLALIARRAAEDSGVPFLVVHDRAHAAHVESVAPPVGGALRSVSRASELR